MLETVVLKNFKSIKNHAFNFKNLTVFSGLNGMGKSSLMQSLLLLRQSFEKNMLPGKALALVGDYVKIGNGADLLYVDSEDDKIEYEVYWSDSLLKLTIKCNRGSNVQAITEKTDDESCYKESLFTSCFQYLSAERISPNSSYAVSDYDVSDLNSIGITGQFTAHFIAEKGLKPIAIQALCHPKSGTDKTLLGNINAWMSEITPGTRVVTKVMPEINQASLHYQFSTANGFTKEFRPENTGFGLTYVLPVVTAVLNAKKGDLLLIENPESHLHPAGQSAIGRLIALAAHHGVQIIVETHSDHFLNGVRISIRKNEASSKDVALYYLSRDKDSAEHNVNIETILIDSDGKIDHWPKGFFDEWDNSLDELLRAKD